MGMIERFKGLFMPRGSEETQTGNYMPFPAITLVANAYKRPFFSLWQIELMLLDYQVGFALTISNGPLYSKQVVFEADDPEVADFAREQWEKIWSTSAWKILLAKAYGWMGYEVVYSWNDQDGCFEFNSLRDIHPIDSRPLLNRAGQVVGMNVYGNRITTEPVGADGIPVKVMDPTCFWYAYKAKHGQPFGRSALEKSYAPWFDKTCEGGALDLRRLRNLKDSWIGDQLKVPFSRQIMTPDGSLISYRDMARQIAENRASGGVIVTPSERDEAGNFLVEYSPPTPVQGSTEIGKWIEALDADILDGCDVPREVVEAAATGSGYSGRSVPMQSFFSARDGEFSDLFPQLKRKILDPLVIARYGRIRGQYKAIPVPLQTTFDNSPGNAPSQQTASEGGELRPGEVRQARQYSADEAPDSANPKSASIGATAAVAGNQHFRLLDERIAALVKKKAAQMT